MIAATHHLEWLLPWWWHHYAAHNALPVAVVDLGLSEEAKRWVEERGLLIPLTLSHLPVFSKESVESSLAHQWETLVGSGVWDVRTKWLQKPFAFAASPFDNTLWLDVDCEVRGPLLPLFSYLDEAVDLVIGREPPLLQQGLEALKLKPPGEILYNSGVVLYRKTSQFLSLWQEEVLLRHSHHVGDQEALSRVLYHHPFPIRELVPEENWDRGLGPNREALIFHWQGQKGKELIRQETELLLACGFLKSFTLL